MTTEHDKLKVLVRFIAANTNLQSRLLYPHPQWEMRCSPEELCNLIRDTFGVSEETISAWVDET